MLVNKEGVRVIKTLVILVLASYILTYLNKLFYIFTGISGLFILFCIYFFRDPERNIQQNDKYILSPADGTVLDIKPEDGTILVKIFMSVFNVHVQRSPITGVIETVVYKKGEFLPADKSDADKRNEQNTISIKNKDSRSYVIVKQIAGILARRIVFWGREGESIVQGQRIGMIKFGSQVDLCISDRADLKIKTGQKVYAGKTIIAEI